MLRNVMQQGHAALQRMAVSSLLYAARSTSAAAVSLCTVGNFSTFALCSHCAKSSELCLAAADYEPQQVDEKLWDADWGDEEAPEEFKEKLKAELLKHSAVKQ